MDREIMKGGIDILLLSLLTRQDMYGYQMVKVLKENSHDLYSMGEGTLYPALKRLERKEWLHSYWGDSDSGGRRKYYGITDAGKRKLNQKVDEWKKVNTLIQRCMEG